jgi:hypothetical protein
MKFKKVLFMNTVAIQNHYKPAKIEKKSYRNNVKVFEDYITPPDLTSKPKNTGVLCKTSLYHTETETFV